LTSGERERTGRACTLFADGINREFIADCVGVGAKDLTDELSGVVFKSRYMIPAPCVSLAFFSNGGDVILKPGYALEIEPARN